MTDQQRMHGHGAAAGGLDLLAHGGNAHPHAVRHYGSGLVFRGRLRPCTARLPARPARAGARGTTFGLSSAPAVLHTVSASFRVPANSPWVVLSSTEWRITVSDPTDLHLVHNQVLATDLVDDALAGLRPTRFEPGSAKIVRAAVRAATPVWVDDRARPIGNLAKVAPGERWRLEHGGAIGGGHDTDALDAFAMMVTWALEQQPGAADPRLGPVLQHIAANLLDPAMTTTTLASQVRLSRRTLQTLFAPYGGPASYIRQQRVDAAITLLTAQPGPVADLDAVAAATGLGSRRTLERAVRQVYGLTPRQAREHVLAGFRLRRRGVRGRPGTG